MQTIAFFTVLKLHKIKTDGLTRSGIQNVSLGLRNRIQTIIIIFMKIMLNSIEGLSNVLDFYARTTRSAKVTKMAPSTIQCRDCRSIGKVLYSVDFPPNYTALYLNSACMYPLCVRVTCMIYLCSLIRTIFYCKVISELLANFDYKLSTSTLYILPNWNIHYACCINN